MVTTAKWEMSGIITEARRLTSSKNKDWAGFVCKVATLGSTFEVQMTKDQFEKVGEGDQGQFNGKFEDQRGNLRFILTEMKLQKRQSA